MTDGDNKRIVLIHALIDSQKPAWDAFSQGWPQARIFNLLDDSLAPDLATDGSLTTHMIGRFMDLGRYAASTGAQSGKADAILFTCSAFGPAIDKVKTAVDIPVLRPNEAAFEAALEMGDRIGLLVSFENALPPLTQELQAMARAAGKHITICSAVAQGALQALKAGHGDQHDAIVANSAKALQDVDALVLCQFSLARAAPRVAPVRGRTLLTTPDTAVIKLRSLLSE